VLHYTGGQTILDELWANSIFEIKTHSDFDDEELIATGSYYLHREQ